MGLVPLLSLLILFAFSVPAEAQHPKNILRIGYLAPVFSCAGSVPSLESFRQGLQELGYIEGQNTILECRSAAGNSDRLRELAIELVRLKVDVIVAAGGELVARAAQQASQTIPIVMTNVCDPIGAGLIVSMAQPGANITGLSIMSPDLSGKRLELLKEAVPKIRSVAVFLNPNTPCNVVEFKATETAGLGLALQIQSVDVRRPADFDKAFSAISQAGSQALLTLPDPITNSEAKRIADFAAKNDYPPCTIALSHWRRAG